MIEAPKPFYKSSSFLKIFFSLLTALIQNLVGVPLISTPLIDQLIMQTYSQYSFMQVAAATVWVTISEFIFAALVIWFILRALGNRTKLTILCGALIVAILIIAEISLKH